jgi:uncharacterized protein YraI
MMKLLKAAALAFACMGATAAVAAPALVTTNLNVRTGPGTNYGSIGSLPNGAIVDVVGCTSGYSWCRVNYRGLDGWASSRYLAQQEGGYAGRSYSSSAASIGIPLVAGVVIGSALSNDRSYYRGRDRFYDRRDFRRDVRRDIRRDWRDDRRADRRDWRDDRRAIRREFRDPSRRWEGQSWYAR